MRPRHISNGMNKQFLKFLGIGILNTAIDFIILNLILIKVDETLLWFVIAKTIAFTGATTNSFIWNKLWTFKSSKSLRSEITPFLFVSCSALLLNVLSASLMFHLIIDYLPSTITANISAVIASVVAFSVNYFGYKHIVFKKS